MAELDLMANPAAARYFRRRGYGIGEPASPPDAESIDARDYAEPQPFGSTLRDAAVNPRKSDYLPPVNAGEADPHGPEVVAPEVHGSGPKGIKGGPVHVHEVRKQEEAESALAEEVLVDSETHVEADHATETPEPKKTAKKSKGKS
ncbi:MAG TPA: hypothetical protein VFM74_04575 [Candidatus Limnocylindria bacterium]|nr:hypothetical protein [Candidatus Limnocylindria bacterium]